MKCLAAAPCPKFEKSQGKKPTSVNHSAATASTAASAVDLVDEDDDHLDKHATNDGHVWEAVYASVAFTAAQPVEIDATAAEAAAFSKAIYKQAIWIPLNTIPFFLVRWGLL